MNNYQFIYFFISLIYVFYSLWGRFYDSDRYYNLLLKRKFLIINLCCAIFFALIGTALDSNLFRINVQTSVYYIPIGFLVILNLFNSLSYTVNKRKFHSIAMSVDMSPNRKDFFDLFSTLMIILLSFITPVIMFNLILNGKLLN